MADPLEEKFISYWGNHPMHSCLAIVDPRLKLDRVELCMSKIYDNLTFSYASYSSSCLDFSQVSRKFQELYVA